MSSEMFGLSGRKALLSGASRGIGLAIAKAFAQNGAELAIIARDPDRLESAKKQIQESYDKKVWIFPFDLENTCQLEELSDNIIRQTGDIDILVNCAGTIDRIKAEDIDINTWNRVIAVNLTAALILSQCFCKHRKQLGKGGKIINIGSLMCHGARPTTASYASSKGGLLMLTKSLAVEWAKYNINVNAIGPGYIATDLTVPLQNDAGFSRWVTSKTPLGRWGQPQDISGAAVFLASSASDFVTGQILYVDGGWLAAL
jgi:gluconate 5-dehydrogenase